MDIFFLLLTHFRLLPDVAAAEIGSIATDEAAAAAAADDDGHQQADKGERPPPRPLLDVLQRTSLEGLDDARFGQLHLVAAYGDECSRLVAHCLSWKLVLALCGCADSELRYQYAAHLGSCGSIARLMDDLFRIIPHLVQQQPVDLEQELQADAVITTAGLQNLATQVYTSALRYLPAVIRRWWNNADKRTASLVEKFTCK